MRVVPEAGRGEWREFTIEARFALRVEASAEGSQQTSGRLTWEHGVEKDRLLLANPLGQGMAELESGPDGAVLRLASGEQRRAADATQLLAGALGYALPVQQLPAWLLGRVGPNGKLQQDSRGRPLQLNEAGWQIDYAYDDDLATSLPSRLTLQRAGEIELRLRIEEWR